jgi:hypothetical protein
VDSDRSDEIDLPGPAFFEGVNCKTRSSPDTTEIALLLKILLPRTELFSLPHIIYIERLSDMYLTILPWPATNYIDVPSLSRTKPTNQGQPRAQTLSKLPAEERPSASIGVQLIVCVVALEEDGSSSECYYQRHVRHVLYEHQGVYSSQRCSLRPRSQLAQQDLNFCGHGSTA